MLTMPLPVPCGARMVRAQPGQPGEKVGSALLDQLLSIRCPPPHDRLHEPGLAAALVSVLHGIPDACLDEEALSIQGLQDDALWLGEVLTRVFSLRERWPERWQVCRFCLCCCVR